MDCQSPPPDQDHPNLLAKLNLILILVFAVGLIPAAMVSRNLLTTNAETQVLQNARIMMETAMAMLEEG